MRVNVRPPTKVATQQPQNKVSPRLNRDTALPLLDSQLQADVALEGVPTLVGSMPVNQYLAKVKRALEDKGLPTQASGVRVYVVGERISFDGDPDPHAISIINTIAGPMGMAPGCDLRLLSVEQTMGKSTPAESAAWSAAMSAACWLPEGKVSLDQLADAFVLRQATTLMRRVHDLASVRAELARRGEVTGPTLVNMSYSTALIVHLRRFLPAIAKAPRGSPLAIELEGAGLLTAGEADHGAIARFIRDKVEAMAPNDRAPLILAEARNALTEEVKRCRSQGIVAFASAGNFIQQARSWLGNDKAAIPDCMGIDGIINVAAIDLGDVNNPNDDKVWDDSCPGDVAMLGKAIPFGDQEQNGTSLAAPILMAVAALMYSANPGLAPEQIERILLSPDVARDMVDDTRDGAGSVDIVAAVEAAQGVVCEDASLRTMKIMDLRVSEGV